MHGLGVAQAEAAYLKAIIPHISDGGAFDEWNYSDIYYAIADVLGCQAETLTLPLYKAVIKKILLIYGCLLLSLDSRSLPMPKTHVQRSKVTGVPCQTRCSKGHNKSG